MLNFFAPFPNALQWGLGRGFEGKGLGVCIPAGDLGAVQAGLEVWQIAAIFTVSLALHSLRCYLYPCTVLSLAKKPCTVSACISSLPP